ncbi:hypothetical protein GGF43_005486 [Coemansia sp. RSA 2618]|nr:hypothetical protein GGF43_005486 [Coemansia sp. RSA 2618]
MQDEEDKAMFRESTDNTDDSGLPTHITRLFNKCPVVKRKPGSGLASGQRSAVVSIYYSPCISLSELGIVDACSDSTSSKHSNDSVASTVISRSASKANIISKHASLCESVTANKDVPAQSGWAFAPATQVSQMLWGTAS